MDITNDMINAGALAIQTSLLGSALRVRPLEARKLAELVLEAVDRELKESE